MCQAISEYDTVGDTKWLQVSGLKFDTFIESEKFEILKQGKLQAKQLLESYIEQITELSKIRKEKVIIEEDNYKKKYSDLLGEWNKIVPDYNELLLEKDKLLETVEFKEQEKHEQKRK
ncbi:hypothetical protein L3073_03925 [Ancylomarina sp. DW003]|nr:hypothetical protein [Ancylomarina sp. DW003]MDE5421346.1 hypothetical protein [Ancylomarina sp. DW003]